MLVYIHKFNTSQKTKRNSIANKIGDEPENIFEALTYGLTILDDSDATLKCHIDNFNDPHNGFNILMSVYFHYFYEPIGKTVWVAFLGYT